MTQNAFAVYRQQCEQRVNQQLIRLLDAQILPFAPLGEAMRYSLINGGKRIRPLLVYAACEALDGDLAHADGAAMAVELTHAYSLIHDDLPTMDDDDLRRGQPTCHRVFGEALAILAGNSLQTLAFEALITEAGNPINANVRLAMLNRLAQAAGAAGLQGGQAIDLNAVGKALTQNELAQMHRYKTGALIEASVHLGALSSGKAGSSELQALQQYSQMIGLAFQVQDDILDVESDTETLGKTQGKDKQHDKPSFAALLGLPAAKDYAEQLCAQALEALQPFGEAAEPLCALARYIVVRRN